MQCYQTRYEDGVFTGVAYADPDPLEPGRMVLPGACVDIAPPAYHGWQQARWTGRAWIIEDAPPRMGERDGAVCGVHVKWDGADFQGVLIPVPELSGAQRAEWNGKSWRVVDVPLPKPTPAPELTPAEKLAAAGLTIADLKALGVKVA